LLLTSANNISVYQPDYLILLAPFLIKESPWLRAKYALIYTGN